MAHAVRKQIRDAVALALTGLATTGARVFENRLYELQDAELPALRVYTSDEEIATASLGPSNRARQHNMNLVIECCSKLVTAIDDELDAMIKEVLTAIDANQGAGGAKFIEPRRVEIEMEGDAEKQVGIARMSFEVLYFTAQGSPDVAL